jgi:Rrf2 family protein
MRLSAGVEWAVHCATVLALLPDGATLPAAPLAEFHDVPPSYLAKVLQALARAGIVTSISGRAGGYRLARPATEITLLDVVLAADGDEPAFRCTEIRKRGPGAKGVAARAYPPRCGIAGAMWEAEEAWRESLRARTIADITTGVLRDAPPKVLANGAVWIGAVLTARGVAAS